MVLHEQANVCRAEDVRVGVAQRALAHAWRRGSDVWGASQAPDRTRAPSLMLLMTMQCWWCGCCVDGHACGAGRPAQGAGGSQGRGRAPGERV